MNTARRGLEWIMSLSPSSRLKTAVKKATPSATWGDYCAMTQRIARISAQAPRPHRENLQREYVFRKGPDSCRKRAWTAVTFSAISRHANGVPGTAIWLPESTTHLHGGCQDSGAWPAPKNCKDLRLFIIVGRSSATVGWMCIALCSTVNGALA